MDNLHSPVSSEFNIETQILYLKMLTLAMRDQQDKPNKDN